MRSLVAIQNVFRVPYTLVGDIALIAIELALLCEARTRKFFINERKWAHIIEDESSHKCT